MHEINIRITFPQGAISVTIESVTDEITSIMPYYTANDLKTFFNKGYSHSLNSLPVSLILQELVNTYHLFSVKSCIAIIVTLML